MQTGSLSMSGDVSTETRSTAHALTAPFLLTAFIVAMILPVSINLGGLRLSPIRILLLLTFVPVVFKIMAGAAGKFRFTDMAILLFGAWVIVTLVRVDGWGRFPYASIVAVEMAGGYFLGRYLIRNAVDWKRLVVLHLLSLAVMAPFAVIELLTGKQLWMMMLDPIGEVTWRHVSSRPRMGFERVLAGFDHPILFGLYCSLGAANVFYIWRDQIATAVTRFGFVSFMTFASLSSGALLSVLIQGALIAWDRVTKGAWVALASIVASIWIFLDLASNRGALIIFMETMTFNINNAWTRVNQWTYGGAEVMSHPIFGIGLGDWDRPWWLNPSIDAFWLAIAMRHGLVGIGLLALVIIPLVVRTMRAKNLSPLAGRYRTGWLLGFAGLFFTLTTVHVWDAISVFVMFYVGAGAWYASSAAQASEDVAEAVEAPSGPVLRRNLPKRRQHEDRPEPVRRLPPEPTKPRRPSYRRQHGTRLTQRTR